MNAVLIAAVMALAGSQVCKAAELFAGWFALLIAFWVLLLIWAVGYAVAH